MSSTGVAARPRPSFSVLAVKRPVLSFLQSLLPPPVDNGWRLPKIGWADLLPMSVAAVFGAAVCYPIVDAMSRLQGDYAGHAGFAQRFAEDGVLYAPACLLHLIAAAMVRSGITASYLNSIVVITLASYGLTAAAIYVISCQALCPDKQRRRWLPFLFAMVVPFIQPATITPGRGAQIGYLWAEPYHNPTYALLKPFALVSTALLLSFLAGRTPPGWRRISICAVIVAAGTLAKPNLAICALPAIAVWAAYAWLRKEPVPLKVLILAWIVPAVAVLSWQHQWAYWGDPSTRYHDSIVFAPLKAMRIHSTNLALQYLLTILFPLTVLAVYPKRAWQDIGFRFSAIAFLFGTAYTYTLGEKIHMGDGNFLWSAYITLFLLYLFSTLFLIRQIRSGATRSAWLRAAPCVVALGWHLTSGSLVYGHFLKIYAPGDPPVMPVSAALIQSSETEPTFRFTFYDRTGASAKPGPSDTVSFSMLFSESLNTIQECYLIYGPVTNGLYLTADSGMSYLGPVKPGTNGTLENKHCSVDVAASSVSRSGKNVMVDVALRFAPSFAGKKKISMMAHNYVQSSGWKTLGAYTVQ